MSALTILETAPWAYIAAAVIIGLCVGSFLNVVIHRLPKMMEARWRAECAEFTNQEQPQASERYNLLVPSSQCPACGHRISAIENVPVMSYIALGGKCSACRVRISPRYPVVEVLSGALSGFIAWRYGLTLASAAAMFYVWMMMALAFIDLDTFYLPDDLTLPLMWAGLLFNLAGGFTDLASAVAGAAAGYLILWIVFWIFKAVTGKEGMGYGDFKLLAAIGAWLGWKMLPLVILLSSFVGALVGIVLIILARRGRNVPIPFGPYLATAGLVALFYGETLTRQYLELF